MGDGGPATASLLYDPRELQVDAKGNIYIADAHNYRIRKINRGGIISTIAGTGSPGFFGDGMPATAAIFSWVSYIRLDCGGNLYIGDEHNMRVRKITYNHAPVFTRGHSQSFQVCENAGARALDSILMVYDTDTLQTETWSILKPPANGTLAVAYNASSTGDTLIPAGTSYTPATGFSGMDTFRVIIADCGHLSDTTNFYVTVIPPPDAGVVTGADTVCTGGAAATLHDAAAGGTWTVSNSRATVTGGVVTGVAAGKDTVLYTVTNSCGTDTAMHVMTVKPCVNGVAQPRPSPGEREVLRVYPNPIADVVYIDGVQSPAQYRLLSILGVVVQEGALNSGSNCIPVKGLVSGVYVLEVSFDKLTMTTTNQTMTGGGRTIIRIIKQ